MRSSMLLTLVLLGVLAAGPVAACVSADGQFAEDQQLANRLCDELPDVFVTVKVVSEPAALPPYQADKAQWTDEAQPAPQPTPDPASVRPGGPALTLSETPEQRVARELEERIQEEARKVQEKVEQEAQERAQLVKHTPSVVLTLEVEPTQIKQWAASVKQQKQLRDLLTSTVQMLEVYRADLVPVVEVMNFRLGESRVAFKATRTAPGAAVTFAGYGFSSK
jgi:hypothetical protein